MISRRKSQKGFTLVEVVMAIAIALALAGIAVPNVVAAANAIRLSSSTAAVAGLLQQMRLQAVTDDRHYTMHSGNSAGAAVLYADLNGDGALGTTEPAVQVAGGIVPGATGNPAITTMALDFIPQPAGTPVTFNARGVPCVIAGASCKTSSSGAVVGFVYFLARRVGTSSVAWSGITVSPSGRIKTWTWNGASWSQR